MIIKCDCSECNCDNATADGVCYECTRGLHATSKWKDGVKIRKQDKKPVEVPERIWLQWNGDGDPYEGEGGVTWSSDRINDDDVEYIKAGSTMEGMIAKIALEENKRLKKQVKIMEGMRHIKWAEPPERVS